MGFLSKSILPQTANEDNAVGGNLNRVFVGKVKDDVTGFAMTGTRVSSFTFAVDAGFVELYTRQDGVTHPLEAAQTERGAGRVTTETINAIVKKQGADWREAVNDIMKGNGYVGVVVNNQGECEVFGIYDRLDTTFTIGKGARPSQTQTEDAAFPDEKSRTITFVSETREHGGLLFGTGVLASDLATLEGYLVEA